MAESDVQVIKGEDCPMCHKKTLQLMESLHDIPFFGACSIFAMDCEACRYHMADVEPNQSHPGARFTLEISSEDDLKIRVVKSSTAVIKIPHMITVEPGEISNGYVTNVEGILSRIRKQIQFAKEEAEEPSIAKKAKNQLKKLDKALWGQEKLSLIIEDKRGNSAIISEKAVKKLL